MTRFKRLVARSVLALAIASFIPLAALAADEALKPVKLLQTRTGSMTIERQFFGQVAAKQSVDLAFQVGGQVVMFPVAQGFVVPKGQMVAQLDLEPFELQLEQARLQKEQADRTVARLEKLAGTVSQVSIDDAETQAGLAGVALRNAEYELQHATLTAPFDALVSSREVDNFTTVGAGTPIVRLHDMSELHIKVDVPEILFQQADQSDQVEITASFPGWDTTYPVEILEFDAEASSVGQTYRVTFRLAPPKDRQILPGASVAVRVKVETDAEAIVLPATAIVTSSDGKTGVMVFSPSGADQGSVAWHAVTVTPTQDGEFAVQSGLEGGEDVVLTGGNALNDGQAVRRFAGFAN